MTKSEATGGAVHRAHEETHGDGTPFLPLTPEYVEELRMTLLPYYGLAPDRPLRCCDWNGSHWRLTDAQYEALRRAAARKRGTFVRRQD